MFMLYDNVNYQIDEDTFRKFNCGEIGEYELVDNAKKVVETTVEECKTFENVIKLVTTLNEMSRDYVLVFDSDEELSNNMKDDIEESTIKLCLQFSEDENEAFDIIKNEYPNDIFSVIMNNFFDITMVFSE